MRVAQSSVYRAVETMLLWFIPIGARVPNTVTLRTLASECTINLNDSLTAIALALQSDDSESKIQCYDAVLLHLTKVKTAIRILKDYSDTSASTHIITDKQMAPFIRNLSKIQVELTRMRLSALNSAKDPSNIYE